jgi:hypothetical protein
MRFPGRTEVCDTAAHDEDCDPLTYGPRDVDGDGHPDIHCCNTDASGVNHCGDDCDDGLTSVYSGAPEICDMHDNDCNGMVDEGQQQTVYRDADGDGYGDQAAMAMMRCFAAGSGYADNNRDCDDSVATINPSTPEICDGIDNDCDGHNDDGCPDTIQFSEGGWGLGAGNFSGGGPFNDLCPSGTVLTGVMAYANGNNVANVQGICHTVEITYAGTPRTYGIAFGGSPGTPQRGGPGSEYTDFECPPGSALVSGMVTFDDGTPRYAGQTLGVHYLELACGSLTITGSRGSYRLEIGSPVMLGVTSGYSTMGYPQSFMASSGTVYDGIGGRYGSWIDVLEFHSVILDLVLRR